MHGMKNLKYTVSRLTALDFLCPKFRLDFGANWLNNPITFVFFDATWCFLFQILQSIVAYKKTLIKSQTLFSVSQI